MDGFTLNPSETNALRAFIEAQGQRHAAQVLGLARNTLRRVLQNKPAFRATLTQVRTGLALAGNPKDRP